MLFLSTPSARRATHSNPLYDIGNLFLSTPSARRATFIGSKNVEFWKDFYPRPPRGGRRRTYLWEHNEKGISIHALREEGDQKQQRSDLGHQRISIHALREEGDG